MLILYLKQTLPKSLNIRGIFKENNFNNVLCFASNNILQHHRMNLIIYVIVNPSNLSNKRVSFLIITCVHIHMIVKLWVGSDSVVAVQLLHQPCSPSHPYASMILAIKELCSRDWAIQITHVLRVGILWLIS